MRNDRKAPDLQEFSGGFCCRIKYADWIISNREVDSDTGTDIELGFNVLEFRFICISCTSL